MASFDQLSAAQSAAGVRAGDFSATEVARASLDAVDAREPQVQAFLEVSADLALNVCKRRNNVSGASSVYFPHVYAGVALSVTGNGVKVCNCRCCGKNCVLPLLGSETGMRGTAVEIRVKFVCCKCRAAA